MPPGANIDEDKQESETDEDPTIQLAWSGASRREKHLSKEQNEPVLQEVIQKIPAIIFSGHMRGPEELTLWPEANPRYLSNLILETWENTAKARISNMQRHGAVPTDRIPNKRPHRAEARKASGQSVLMAMAYGLANLFMIDRLGITSVTAVARWSTKFGLWSDGAMT
jgi:hypothetical protein